MSKKNPKKKSWIKRIFKFFAWLIIILAILIVAVYLTLGIIVKKAVTTVVPPVTGTTVNVEDVDLSLLSGHVSIKGFKIGNPDGFAAPSIFELGSIVVEFEPKSILSDKIIIKKVAIDKTSAAAEIDKRGEVNIMVLQQNIENYLNQGSATTAADKKTSTTASESGGSGKKVIIKDLTINDSKLQLGVIGQVMTINLPNIHKTGIGEEKGKSKTMPEMIATVLSYFSEASIKGIAQSGNQMFMQGLENTKAILNQGKEAVNKQLDNVKDSAEKIGSGVKDSVKGVGDSVKNVGQSLGGIFKK